MNFQTGSRIKNKYTIQRVLGEGGMAVVYAAEQRELQRTVAIKVIREEALAFPETSAWLVREAQTAARIRSQHATQILDVDKLDSGVPFIVMEYLNGHDLGDWLAQRGIVPGAVVADWLLQACVAIAEAHSLGVVHRDLKPQNLFLTQSVGGEPLIKVLDFGIAAPRQLAISSNATAEPSSKDIILGSPNYMAPEQFSSATVDERADIWALGVVAFELCTNCMPFDAEGVEQVTQNVQHREPDWSKLDGAPEQLVHTIQRCLSKVRERRYQSVVELARALSPLAPARAQLVLPILNHLQRPKSGAPGEISQQLPPETLGAVERSSPASNHPGASRGWPHLGLAAAVVLTTAMAVFFGYRLFNRAQLAGTFDEPVDSSSRAMARSPANHTPTAPSKLPKLTPKPPPLSVRPPASVVRSQPTKRTKLSSKIQALKQTPPNPQPKSIPTPSTAAAASATPRPNKNPTRAWDRNAFGGRD